MTRIAPMIAAILIALVLGACGDSGEENASEADQETNQSDTQETAPSDTEAAAKQTVCDARDDIAEQVDTLKGITPETFTAAAVATSLGAIQSDVSDINGAMAELSGDLREQVQTANQTFKTQVESTVKDIGTSTTVTEAENAITGAADELSSSYEDTFAGIDCG
jgi:hypothetical protein